MKYEEIFTEIRYHKPNLVDPSPQQHQNLEAIKKIVTYKLSL